MIKIHNLTKIYKGASYEVKALNDVDIEINDGEFVAVMGESGSGKTTLLNCIGIMDEFDDGEYFLDDVNAGELSRSKKCELRKNKISFVFQHFELMRNYTVFENIEIPLLAKNVKRSERKKRIMESVAALGIDDLLDKYPYELSGGQKQRAAIARAVVADNPYILADEPTGALDSRHSMELMEELKRINAMGKTVIMVTHDINMARKADRIIKLVDGRVAECDNVSDI